MILVYGLNLPIELDELFWCSQVEGGLDHFSSLGLIVNLVDSHW